MAPRVLWTLQNWQSHWLPSFRWVLPQKEWVEPRGRFCWAPWDVEFCRPNSVPNYVLLLQSNLTLVGPSQVVAIVDANCSTVKNFLKNSSISICISVQTWEEGGEEPQNAEFLFFCGYGELKTYCLALSGYYVSVEFSIRTCQPLQLHCFRRMCVGTGNFKLGLTPIKNEMFGYSSLKKIQWNNWLFFFFFSVGENHFQTFGRKSSTE